MTKYRRFGRQPCVAVTTLLAVLLVGAGELRAQALSCTSAGLPVLPILAFATSNPISCTVNCAQGGKIASAIAMRPRTTNTLTITINGTCTEAIDDLGYSRITFQGGSSGGAIQAPSSSTNRVVSISGQNITLNNLTISGGVTGLGAIHGSQFDATNLVIEGASTHEIQMQGANASLTDSTVDAPGGILVQGGGFLTITGGVIQNSDNIGLNVGEGASVFLNSGAVVRNNIVGVFVGPGGVASFFGGTVEANSGDGVYIENGGIAYLANGAVVQSNTGDGVDVVSGQVGVGLYGSPATVEGNGGDGIYRGTNSIARFGNAAEIINNGGWGILCAGLPSNPIGNGSPGTVSGNKAGQIYCNFGN
jgi:hypothetical protein